MDIRKAEHRDIGRILDLLSQVLEIHAAIRPDIFISGTTKYGEEELKRIIDDPNTPVYVAVDGNDLLGYAFCVIENHPATNNTFEYKSLYIDDLCVDSGIRGKGVGKAIFEFVRSKAGSIGCREITLNVWEGNDAAYGFYEKIGFKPRKTLMEYKI